MLRVSQVVNHKKYDRLELHLAGDDAKDHVVIQGNRHKDITYGTCTITLVTLGL